jgi:OmpA-OmpF porin, OOP family
MRQAAWILAAVLLSSQALAQDEKGSVDAPVISRYEGSRIYRQGVKAFDERAFLTRDASGKKTGVSVKGKRVWTVYVGMKGRSGLEVFRNYQRALATAGFRTVYTCSRQACGGFFYDAIGDLRSEFLIYGNTDITDNHYLVASRAGPGGTEYVRVAARDGSDAVVLFDIVQPAAMEQKVSVLSATDITTDLNRQGKALLYAIIFDFDSAVIKPGSKPQMDQLAAYLRSAPGVKVFIVGHTDGKGTVEYNSNLSRQRASAVVTSLVADYGIASARLSAHGVGQLAPVGSNETDDGRARNRRVEIVKRLE